MIDICKSNNNDNRNMKKMSIFYYLIMVILTLVGFIFYFNGNKYLGSVVLIASAIGILLNIFIPIN